MDATLDGNEGVVVKEDQTLDRMGFFFGLSGSADASKTVVMTRQLLVKVFPFKQKCQTFPGKTSPTSVRQSPLLCINQLYCLINTFQLVAFIGGHWNSSEKQHLDKC